MPCVYIMAGNLMFQIIVHVCGSFFSANHAIYRHGGLTFMHHYKLWDLTASWLQEVCHYIAVEPPCNHLLVSLGLQIQLFVVMMLRLTSMQGASAVDDRVLF